MARRLASKVIIYTNGAKDLSEQLVSSLGTDVGIKVDERPIARLEKGPTEPEVIVHFADGESITEGFLVNCSLFFSKALPSIHASLPYKLHCLLENSHSLRSRLTNPRRRSMGLLRVNYRSS